MRRIGLQSIAEKKAEIVRQAEAEMEGETKREDIGRKSLQDRNLLTLLIKANMATDIPDHQRLSDEDVLARKS